MSTTRREGRQEDKMMSQKIRKVLLKPTGLGDGAKESRKACSRRGDSSRERAGVPGKSRHRRPLNYPSKLGRNSQGPGPLLVTFSGSVLVSVRWGEKLLPLIREQMRETYAKNERGTAVIKTERDSTRRIQSSNSGQRSAYEIFMSNKMIMF